MKTINHEAQPREEWRTGVVTRMLVSAMTGSHDLCIFEQWCAPGTGAPTHSHRVEEVLSVLSGKMEVWLGDMHETLVQSESIIVPAGTEHGFRNAGKGELHVQAILAAPYFEAIRSPSGEVNVKWNSQTTPSVQSPQDGAGCAVEL